VESRSLDESSLLDESTTSIDPPSPSPSSLRSTDSSSRIKTGGEWIKILDISSSNMRTIAHFKLPPSRTSGVPSVAARTRRFSETGHSPVSHLAFSPDGTTLFAAPADGRSFHLFDIHPYTQSSQQVQGEVWHLYELRRGNTASEVVEVKWSRDERWIGVATGRGTVRKLCVSAHRI
jgi:WD40 repeat protein